MKTKLIAWLNNLKLSLAACGVILATALAHGQCIPPPSGIIDWWPGDDNANDIIGTNNGTLVGGVTFTPGEVGEAFSFDGSSGYVELGNWFNLQTFTICMWVKPSASQTTYADLIDDNHNESRSWVVEYQNTGLEFEFNYGYDFSLAPNVWQHLTLIHDANNNYYVYTNGVLTGSPLAGVITYDGTQSLRLAGWAAGGRNFAGQIDELSIFNRALTTNEIAGIYNAGSAGMCRFWFTSQPQSQIGYLYQSVTFEVNVASALPITPVAYQWLFGTNQILGATNSTLVLTNLQVANAGVYSVVASSSYGSITSDPANLIIEPAGVSIALYPGVNIDGVVGKIYGIQYTTDLSNTNSWIGLTNLTLTVTPQLWYDTVPAEQAERYYRVLAGPIPIP